MPSFIVSYLDVPLLDVGYPAAWFCDTKNLSSYSPGVTKCTAILRAMYSPSLAVCSAHDIINLFLKASSFSGILSTLFISLKNIDPMKRGFFNLHVLRLCLVYVIENFSVA